ncbi:hypothetical protein Emag_000310 [Eimeria magna]
MGATERLNKLQSLNAHIPLNRYALLVLYLIVVLLRGCTYWGWNGIQEMLYKSGAYLWECDDPSVVTELRIGSEKYVDCPVRKQLLGGIFTTALGSNMLSSFLAGVALDALGPKITLFIGILMDVVGWTLLGFSGEKFQAYYAAAFCIGVSADPGYLPLLSISKLFPKNSSFVISVMGSLRSISFSVPVIMSAIYQGSAYGPKDLWKMCVGYVGVGQGISLLVCLLFVPMKSFTTPVEDAELEADEAVKRQTLSSTSSRLQDKRSFWRLIVDPKFLLLVPIFCCALVRSDYYAKSNKEQLVENSSGRDLHQMFAIFNILSFIPGPVFGRIADVYGIVVVLFILNTMGVGMFIFLMFDNLACKGISIVFFFIYTSFVLSNVYCFISLHFPEHAFGKLTGLTSAVGGVFVLLSILWYKKMLEYEYPNNFIVVDGIMVGVGCVVYALVFVLWRIAKKEAQQTKVIDAQKTMTEYAEPTSTVSV